MLNEVVTFIVTAYCACALCTGHTHGITKSGHPVKANHTAACPPSMLGAIIHIDGLGLRVCDDTGSKIKGNHVDVYISDHNKAKKFGVKRLAVRRIK